MVASRKTRSLSVATLGVALLLLGASRAAAKLPLSPVNLAPEMNDTMAGNLTEIANDTIADDENLGVGGFGPIELAPEMNDTMAGNLTVGNMTEIANDTIAADENITPILDIPGRRSLQFQGLQPPQPIFSPGRRSLQFSTWSGRRSLAQRRGVPNLAPEMNDTAGNMTVMNETVVNCTETDTDCINLSFKRIGKGIEKGTKSVGNSVGHLFSGRRSLRKLLDLNKMNLAPEMNDTAGNVTVGNLTEIANDTIADDENLAWGGEWRIP